MNKLLDNKNEVEFSIGTLLLLERELQYPLDTLLFEVEITDELQELVVCYGYMNCLEKSECLEIYRSLDKSNKLSVDLIVNGKILDAFGLGKQQESESGETSNQVRFFSEYMNDFKYLAIGVIGMTKEDFYSSTPFEIFKIVTKYQEHLEAIYNLNKLAHINAIGLTSSKKFKEINPFKAPDKGYRKIDVNKKRAELDFLYKVGE